LTWIQGHNLLVSALQSGKTAALFALVIVAVLPGSPVAATAGQQDMPVVIVSGNSVFKTAEVLVLAGRGGWVPGRGVAGLSVLQDAYYREGYLGVAFETGWTAAAAGDSTVVLVVSEGSIASYRYVRVRGMRTRTQESIQKTLGLEPSKRFVPRVLEQRMQRLLRSYDDAGYPFAQVWIDSLAVDNELGRVDLSLYVVEGRQGAIQNVEVEGLEKTRADLVIRMSGISEGTPYDGSILRDAYLRLRGSGVFDAVSYPRLRVSADGIGVDAVLVVEETKRSNSFAAAIGYAAADVEEDDQLSGLVRLQMNNIGGTLKDLHVFWTNDGNGRSETRLQYRDRFFLGRLFSAGLGLEQIGQDTLFTWQSAGIEAGRPAGRIGGNLVGFSARLNADRNVFSEGPLLRSWRFRLGAGLSLARGNHLKHSFADVLAGFTIARKKSYGRDTDETISINQYILEFDGEGSLGLPRSTAFFLELVYKGLESVEDVVPLSEQYYVGGARTLRGYRENQFHGRRVALARAEFRIGGSPQENLYVFVDNGYILQETLAENRVVREDLFKTGYGFGLRTRSQVGVVGLSFGLGEEVSLGQAKVHILLEQNF
jgi:outer membrane protein insertion porin family